MNKNYLILFLIINIIITIKSEDICSQTNGTKYSDCEGLETINSDWECCYNSAFEMCVNADPENLNNYVDCYEKYLNKPFLFLFLSLFLLFFDNI